jgi:hypothetical protein
MTQNTNIEIKNKNVRKKILPNLCLICQNLREKKEKKIFRFLQHVPESKPEYTRIIKKIEL